MPKQCEEAVILDDNRAELLPALQEIQRRKGYISDEDMQTVADRFDIHPVEVYSVITFYSFLNTERKGRHVIRISDCMPNVMAGKDKIEKEFEKALKIKMGGTTKDKKITLERTGCIGMCDKAPAALIDGELIGNLTPKKAREIARKLGKSENRRPICRQKKRVRSFSAG